MKSVFIAPPDFDLRRPKGIVFETGSFLDNGTGGIDDTPSKHDVCVSTMAGCNRMCPFCAVPTGRGGLDAMLTADEIVYQVAFAISRRNSTGSLPNVVGLMGNGEPLGNPSILDALGGMTELPIDRITVSTVGDRPDRIRELADFVAGLGAGKPAIKLQLSLHSPFPMERAVLIPTTRGKRLDDTLDAADYYTAVTGHPVKYNVVLMNGGGTGGFVTNASADHARGVAEIIGGPSRVEGVGQIARRLKLSAFNPVPGIPFTCPTEQERADYVATLLDAGVQEIKTFKGSGIDIDTEAGNGGFACGQLAATTRKTIEAAL